MAIPFISGPKISAGQSLSDIVDCSTSPPVRITMPPGWTPAHLTFQVSSDGVTFGDLVDMNGQEIKANVKPSTVVRLSSQWITAPVFLKFRSGSSSVPIVQTADRIFGCSMMNDQIGSIGPEGPQGPAGPAGPAGPSAVSANAGNLARLGTDSLILVPNAVVLKGTIAGDDAAQGMIGEVISSSNFGGVALTTAVPMNVTQIMLSPGDWNVGGVVIFAPVGTGPNSVIAALSQTAAALPSDNDVATGKGIMQQIWASSMPAGKTQTTPTSLIRINTSTAKPVYLVAQATFGGGTVTVQGYISARRVR
jgi:hypothetical protein